MTTTVCLYTYTLGYATGAGFLWSYLNWALGLQANGCRVIWMEGEDPRLGWSDERVRVSMGHLREKLRPYGLADDVTFCRLDGALPHCMASEFLDPSDASALADLLLDLGYEAPVEVVRRFRRSALVDIDPGMLQLWVAGGQMDLAPHDVYFTIGETVGRPGARFPDVGLRWIHTPPCVALDWWPPSASEPTAPFTTVSQWETADHMVDDRGVFANDKREGFLPFLNLPRLVAEPLELALCLGPDDRHDVTRELEALGWRVRDADDVAATPPAYQQYIRGSRGEFSCAKPAYVRLQTAWVSDRSICYLASGKPVVVQHTGPSRFLPERDGMLRFRTLDEAAECLHAVARDYDHHCGRARSLAEEYFDARRVTAKVLEDALC